MGTINKYPIITPIRRGDEAFPRLRNASLMQVRACEHLGDLRIEDLFHVCDSLTDKLSSGEAE